jgi:hypothetical protein
MKKELEVLINDINGKLPDNERWVHSPQLKKKLNAALDWAEKTPPKSSKLSQLKEQKPQNQ